MPKLRHALGPEPDHARSPRRSRFGAISSGECMQGELKGSRLELIPGIVTT